MLKEMGINHDIIIIHLLLTFTFLNAELYGKELMKIARLNRLTFPFWSG
jgi:hypothetical protein